MLLRILVVVLAVDLCAAQTYPTYPCCMPFQYEGYIVESGSNGNLGGPPTLFENMYAFSYDYDKLKIRADQKNNPNDKQWVLTDYSTIPAVQYIRYDDGSCRQQVLMEQMRKPCEEDEANRVWTFYMGLAEPMSTTFEAFTTDNYQNYSRRFATWNDQCTLLFTGIFLDGQDTQLYASYGEIFANVTEGIVDESVFDIPPDCLNADVVTGQTSEFAGMRRHLFSYDINETPRKRPMK